MLDIGRQDLNSRKLFIGGLAPHTTKEDLQAHFSQFGSVQDCVLMIDRSTGRSRCFGFVTMKDNESTDRILAEDQEIGGKKVDCKLAVPRDQNTSVPTTTSFRTKKVFVGGLPPDVTQEIFNCFFEQFGEIEDSVVMFDRETGRPRGFGFITFTNEESVEKVIQNSESNYINGKWVECKKAMPKHNQPDERYANYQYTNQNYYNPQYTTQPYTNQMYSNQMYQGYMMYPYYNMAGYQQGSAYDPYWQINQGYGQQNYNEGHEEQSKQKFVDDLLDEGRNEINQQQSENHRKKTIN